MEISIDLIGKKEIKEEMGHIYPSLHLVAKFWY